MRQASRLLRWTKWIGLVLSLLSTVLFIGSLVSPLKPGLKRIVRFDPLFLLFAVPTCVLWWVDRRRIPPGHCQHCGYSLTGNTSGVCPELSM